MTETQRTPTPAVRRGERAYNLAVLAMKCLLIGFCVYQARLAVDALAGTETNVHVAMEWIAKISIPPYLFGGAAILYGLRERGQKREKTRILGQRIKELEMSIDKNRTSSGLLSDGRTNPSDE